MWPVALSGRLLIVGLVGRYPANCLIRRGPIPYHRSFSHKAMLGIKNKYGKNAVLKASSYEEGATMRQRNAQIGGHSAGGSDGKLQK